MSPGPSRRSQQALLVHKTYLISLMLVTRRRVQTLRLEIMRHFTWLLESYMVQTANFPSEMFHLPADNSQCKHIFIAGCHDAGYLSLLTPYRGKADQITLIKAGYFNPEYYALDLSVVDIPSVFWSIVLNGSALTLANKHIVSPNAKEKVSKASKKVRFIHTNAFR
jgi:hypothetical protein